MASCNPATLIADAIQFKQPLSNVARVLRIEFWRRYLIALNSAADTSPQTLLAAGQCFVCLDENQRRAIKLQLLCDISSGIGGCICSSLILATDPESLDPFNVVLTWSLNPGSCEVGQIEIWKSTDGGAFELLASVLGDLTQYTDNAAGSVFETLQYQARYVGGVVSCPFSNVVSVFLSPA